MITLIFNNGTSNPKAKTALLPLSELHNLSLCFDTEEARDEFCSQFPKSLKIYCGFINGYENGKNTRTPHASARMMWTTNSNNKTNKITGEVNEGGYKRMKRFYEAVEKELEKQK